ncbi:MAG: hypothetical protein Q8N96_05375 [Methylovulum sp.]|nr:hypothetical protein [Methylovulum sp.]
MAKPPLLSVHYKAVRGFADRQPAQRGVAMAVCWRETALQL